MKQKRDFDCLIRKTIMKSTKLFVLTFLLLFLFTGFESFARPRYRVYRMCHVKPVHRITVVKKYHKIKKPKKYHKYHKKVIRKIIYY